MRPLVLMLCFMVWSPFGFGLMNELNGYADDGRRAVASRRHLLFDFRPRELLELPGVGVEFADALAQFVAGHGVLVVHPAEGFLVQMDFFLIRRAGGLDAQASLDLALGFLHLLEQIGADR